MYATCLHCNKSLDANESIEAFPVGRRIAFDPARGRLWAVCRHCERWNLSPIEERWEAVEQCERAFRSTGARVSTDNIGLARLRDGTELVRVGSPLRPEFAAWRYGDQFGRRRTKALATGAAVVVGAGAVIAGSVALGVSLVAIVPAFHLLNIASMIRIAQQPSRQLVAAADGTWFRPIGTPRLLARDDVSEGWGVAQGYASRFDTDTPPSMWRSLRDFQRHNGNYSLGEIRLRGSDATALLRLALPRINRGGASRSAVSDGVALIEQAGSAAQFGKWAGTQLRQWSARQSLGDTGDLQHLPAAARLAFEMALHEDSERRALEGELAVLEAAWRHADEIARIADGLLPSPMIDARITQMRGDNRSTSTTGPVTDSTGTSNTADQGRP